MLEEAGREQRHEGKSCEVDVFLKSILLKIMLLWRNESRIVTPHVPITQLQHILVSHLKFTDVF